jgi:hypothetical protein
LRDFPYGLARREAADRFRHDIHSFHRNTGEMQCSVTGCDV